MGYRVQITCDSDTPLGHSRPSEPPSFVIHRYPPCRPKLVQTSKPPANARLRMWTKPLKSARKRPITRSEKISKRKRGENSRNAKLKGRMLLIVYIILMGVFTQETTYCCQWPWTALVICPFKVSFFLFSFTVVITNI